MFSLTKMKTKKLTTHALPPLVSSPLKQTFKDVDKVLVSYFTFRALKETLAQIQETDCSPGKSEYK